MQKLRKKIGITIGDAAGIGPEVALKAVSDQSLIDFCSPVLIGDAHFLSRSARDLGLGLDFLKIKYGESIPEGISGMGRLAIYDVANLPNEFGIGGESPVTGKAAAEYIECAVKLCLSGEIDAISTAPISKKSLSMAGYDFQGHTEFIAHLTDTKEFAMSFFAGEMCVVLLSTHLSLANAIKLVKRDALIRLFYLSHRELSRLLARKPKIAVAGLNPHASEGGMFGNEEENEIIPAIRECSEKYGVTIHGPYSPDTIFLRGYRGEFDAVISCYHDQATIAVKCLSFGDSVNVTLGLPIIRTSVDHGTAFDIAGKNIAEAQSMKTAIKLAAKLAEN